MKTKVLKILRSREDYVSGQELCDAFSVSRTAIWKVINQLKEEGYAIDSVRNKGYRILEAADTLSVSELLSRLATKQMGRHIHYRSEIDSTNSWLKRMDAADCPHGTLTIADMQSSGKGRRGRVWQTPKDTGIPMSLLLRPEISPEHAAMLTLVMGLSVAMALEQLYGLDARIKWPNDIVVEGKKVCGILTEMTLEADYIDSVIIGTGINANMTEFPPELADMATSLRLLLGHPVKRADVVVRVLEIFEENYEKFLRTENLSGLLADYNRCLINKDREVRVLSPGNAYNGKALGIDEQGNLMVQREDNGQIERVYAGEVSVRGLYGYV